MKRACAIGIIFSLIIVTITPSSIYANSTNGNPISDEIITRYAVNQEDLTVEQLSSLAMLNYMTVLTKEINASKSRVFLEEAYDSIVNNINVDVIDPESLDEIVKLLDTIHAYQMIDVKRERIQYIYDQNKAEAFRKAVPNPLYLLSFNTAINPLSAIASVVYMAVDSYDSYTSYTSELEQTYLKDGWELDDAAAEALHESRKDAFTYMVEMCQNNHIPGKMALNEKAVDNFVRWENLESVERRIEALEKNIETYQMYGPYWIALANVYFENKEYDKCLLAVSAYEKLNVDTFKKNYDYAKILPRTILSAGYELESAHISNERYIKIAEYAVQAILKNIDVDSWDLRYFVAQTYVDLARRTGNKEYLRQAFELTKENINYMIDGQRANNEVFLAPVAEVKINKSESKKIKDEKKAYNTLLNEERKHELAPISEALALNCELLFAIADKIEVSDNEKHRIDNMLHEKGKPLFLAKQVDEAYWFFKPVEEIEYVTVPYVVGRDLKIEIPLKYYPQNATLYAALEQNGKKTYYAITRPDIERKDMQYFDQFYAESYIKNFVNIPLNTGDKFEISIVPDSGFTYKTLIYNYSVSVNNSKFGKRIELLPLQ